MDSARASLLRHRLPLPPTVQLFSAGSLAQLRYGLAAIGTCDVN